MISGDYPCCGGLYEHAMPEQTPVFLREECPHCDAIVWHLLSRVEPESWTETEFLRLYTVDKLTKQVTKKPVSVPGDRVPQSRFS